MTGCIIAGLCTSTCEDRSEGVPYLDASARQQSIPRYELVHHSVTKPHRAELGPAEAKEAAVSSGRPERDPASSKSVKSWLGRLDSNQGMPESKSDWGP
jgi:hypothetical protein